MISCRGSRPRESFSSPRAIPEHSPRQVVQSPDQADPFGPCTEIAELNSPGRAPCRSRRSLWWCEIHGHVGRLAWPGCLL